jgi:hypothetical protein
MEDKSVESMKGMVACEFSQIVTQAFRNKGHEMYSCDLLPTEGLHPEWHFQGNVLDYLDCDWDIIIAHPPCTDLSSSGARWFKDKLVSQQESIKFFMEFANCKCPKVAIENPVGIMSTIYRKPNQIIQPWWFGVGETKATCLWLRGLPLLVPTTISLGGIQKFSRVALESPSPDRWKNRSRTYPEIAKAMADQWG